MSAQRKQLLAELAGEEEALKEDRARQLDRREAASFRGTPEALRAIAERRGRAEKRRKYYVSSGVPRGVFYRGETKSIAEWCRLLALNYDTVCCRIKRSGWTVRQAFETPIWERP